VSVVANVAINVDSRGAVNKLRQVQTQAQSTEKAFGALQSAIGALGVGFALTKVIADVKELDTNLRRLGTVGGNVAALDKGLGALSDRLDGVANKAELAAASYQALSAGFTETGANLRVVEAATKAAVGGLVDVTSVVEVTTKTLNAYNMSGDQAAKVTDGISKAVELGQVQWSDYTSQLGRVASIAALAGVSLDELNAFVAAATKNGATAEVAFTGLSATLSQILTPTKESQEAAAKLGIQWNLAGLNAKGLSGLMDELAAAMDKDKEAAARMVGPIEAARGAFAAASKDGSDFKNILEQIGGAAGKADADFQTMKGSLENTLKALDTSFKNLSEALGTAFGPTVVIAVQDITKAVNGFADFMATVPQPVMDTTGELVKLIAQMILLKKAIDAIIGLRLAFIGAMAGMAGATAASGAAATTSAGAFALYTNNTRALQAQAAAATPVLNGLLGTLGRLAAIGAIAIVVNVAVTGMAALLQASAEIAKLRGQRNQPGGAAGDFGGSITPQQRKENEKTLDAIRRERQSPEFKGQQASAALGIGKTAYNLRVAQLQEREIAARARLALPTTAATPTTSTAPTTPAGAAAADAAGGKKKGKTDAERAAEEKRRAAEELANLQGQVTLKEKLFGIDKQIAVEKQRGSIVTAAALEMDKALEERQTRIAEITRSTADTATKNAQIKDATLDADQKIYAVQQAIKEQEAERTKSFNEIIADLNLELALKTATTEQAREQLRLAYELAKLQGQGFTPEQIGAITAKKTELARPKTDRERLEGAAAGVKAELDALTDPINMITTAAAGIGDAFSTSFKGIISGSMTAKEALASFFTSVADMFLDMAAQIIAKMIQMAILNAIVSLLPGSSGGGLGSSQFKPGAPAQMVPSLPNIPNYSGAFKARAKGGPVSSGQTYMVGERGPELFVPGRSGTIVANDKMGGGSTNVVVNVDAKGSSVEGNEQGANQLGRVISAAVQSELIKQQRPGGILAR
jgi:TP901 family phage tail tape measure protein